MRAGNEAPQERIKSRPMSEKDIEDWRERWLEVARWRRRIEQALAGPQLSFTQWLVLDATMLLVRAVGDAVSQSQVAQFLELDQMTLSHAMTALSKRGLVSRGPALSGMSWRVFVTEQGSGLLCSLSKPIAAASSVLCNGGRSAPARLAEIRAQLEKIELKLEDEALRGTLRGARRR